MQQLWLAASHAPPIPWNNFEIISGKFSRTETHIFQMGVYGSWKDFEIFFTSRVTTALLWVGLLWMICWLLSLQWRLLGSKHGSSFEDFSNLKSLLMCQLVVVAMLYHMSLSRWRMLWLMEEWKRWQGFLYLHFVMQFHITLCLKKLCKIVFVRTSSNFHQFG